MVIRNVLFRQSLLVLFDSCKCEVATINALLIVLLRQPALYPSRRQACAPGLSCARAHWVTRPNPSPTRRVWLDQNCESHPCLPPPHYATEPAPHSLAQCFWNSSIPHNPWKEAPRAFPLLR